MNTPLVSVVIPTYNRGALIQRSVESILSQTYSNWELIIVDDGSTDDTEKKVEKYISDKRISYLRMTNGGVSVARNFGISKSRGDFISLLDSDDEYVPEKLEYSIMLMTKNRADFAFAGRLVIVDGNIASSPSPASHFLEKSEIISNKINCSGSLIMCKKNVFEKIRFDETFSVTEDLDFTLRALREVPCLYLGANLVIVHKTLKYERLSTSFERSKRGYEKVLEKNAAGAYGLTPKERQSLNQRIYWSLGLSNLLAGYNRAAQKAFKSILQTAEPSIASRAKILFLVFIASSKVASRMLVSMAKLLWSMGILKSK